MAEPRKFSDETFESDVLQSDKPVLVDFWAPWCGPCLMLTPTIEELAGDYEGRAVVGKVNLDDNKQTSINYQVSSIPTIIVFKGGEVVDRFVGVVAKEKLSNSLDQQLA